MVSWSFVDSLRPAPGPLTEARRAEFAALDWDAPLEPEAELAAIPEDATIAGMFPMPLAAEAAKLGSPLPSALSRYAHFKFYPLRHHVTLMFEAAQVFFPQLSMRKALRKIGRGATPALLTSTLGRVVWATAITPATAIEALARSYAINLKPGEAELRAHDDGHAIVELRDIHYLLDSNHVGAFEGALRPFDRRASVRIHRLGPGHAELLVTW